LLEQLKNDLNILH
jgi:uncharacterized coiled-coil DUF342 family protein